MKEQEAIEELKSYRAQSGTAYPEEIELAIKALEEIQQYRVIGTANEFNALKGNWLNKFDSLIKYREIGTVDECRAAVEKQKELKSTNTCGFVAIGKTVEQFEQEIRNKAIDDFVKQAIPEFTEYDLEHGYPCMADIKGILRDTAEQLKEGVDNEKID